MRAHTTTTSQTNQVQQAAPAAQQRSIRCTTVGKGHCVVFAYQPHRSVAIG